MGAGLTNPIVAGEILHVWGAQLELGSTATTYESKGAIGSTSEVFRGNKADFPRLAGIVAESQSLTIYDLTEAGRPMWMRFAGGPLLLGVNVSSIAASNAALCVGQSNGLFETYLTRDFMRFRQSGNLREQTLISSRLSNSMAVTGSAAYIASNTVNAVAMTVLPDAPLDPVTGLAVPTIAVGTGNGPSVIRHDGVVTNPYGSNLSSPNISFGSRGEVIFHIGENGKNYRVSLPPYTSNFSYIDSPITPVQAIYPINSSVNRVNTKRQAAIRVNATNGLFLFRDNGAGSRSSAGLITNTFNTGHMHGDIRRAYLADIEAGSVSSTELVTNGSFDTSLSGWTLSQTVTASLPVWSAGAMKLVSDGTGFSIADQNITTVANKRYSFTLTSTYPGAGSFEVRVGTTQGAQDLLAIQNIISSGASTYTFVATGTTSWIRIRTGSNNATGYLVDSISVREVIADRSYKAATAPLAGALTKSAVASAAQLVAFSGFDNLDYVREPYSTDLDFGTGDWSVGAWLNTTGFGPHNLLANPERFEDSSWSKSSVFIQTNLLTWSEDFTNAAWYKSNPGVAVLPVVTANAGVAPDGTLTADRVQLDCGNTGSSVNRSALTQNTPAISSGASYTGTVYLKAFDAGNVGKTIRVTSDTVGTIVHTLTADWVRVQYSGAASSTVSNFIVETRGTYTQQTADFLVWGAQFVQGSVPGDYQRTTGATAAVQYAAPNGTLTAETLLESVDSVAQSHYIYQLPTLTAGQAYTISCFAKSIAANRLLQVYLRDSTPTVFASATFNLSTGTVYITAQGTASIAPAGNGWYRLTVTGVAAVSGVGLAALFAKNTSALDYVGDGSAVAFIYGAQLNRGSVATLYKPGQFLAYDNAGWLIDRSAEYLGTELVVNGDFSSGSTGWELGAGWSVTGGRAVAAVGSGFADIRGASNFTIPGRSYQLTFDLIVASGGVRPVLGGVTFGTTLTTSGTYSLVFTATIANYVAFVPYGGGGAFTGSVDNVSVREYRNPHIRLGLDSQGRLITSVSDGITTRTVTSTGTYNSGTWVKAEAAYRAGRLALLANGQEIGFTHGTPLLSLTSRYNLLAHTEDLTQGYWSKILGGTQASATTFNFAATYGSGFEVVVTGIAAGTTMTASFVASGSGSIEICVVDGSGAFGLSSTAVTLTATPTRYSVTRTIVDANAMLRVRNISGVAVTGATCTQMQLERSATVTPYQRVTTVPETNVADLTIGSGTDVYAAFPGSISQVKLSATVPSADQSAWIYEQEKQLFRAGAQCCLPDANSIVDLAYDEVTDRWVAISTTNESNWNGLVRTSVTAVPAGSYSKVSYGGGVELMARSTTNPGVDVSIPPYGLREELVKRAEATARLTRTLSTFDYVGGFTANTTSGSSGLASVANLTYPLTTTIVGAVVTGSGIPAGASVAGISGTNIHLSAAATATATGVQVNFTDFVLPPGYEAEIVMVAGAVKREGATQDFTRLFDGFRETIRFAVAPGNTAWVQIQAMRINA